ncbi:MAG: hypothetical protein HQK60_09500 [Deltaproteobacteria bacterium]|nr:hypothetical protein [Deltaproteobacteria bacterium]
MNLRRKPHLWITCNFGLVAALVLALLIFPAGPGRTASKAKSAPVKESIIVITAEGLSDPNFYKDKTLAYDEALRNAKSQAVEKAVGCFVSSKSIVENYTLVKDQIISKSDGIIKNISKIVNGGVSPDGFYHVWIKADVLTVPIKDAVQGMSKVERLSLIKEQGNPTFSVGMNYVSEGTDRQKVECDICNTEIKNRLKNFGYKVISETEAIRIRDERIRKAVNQGAPQSVVSAFIKKPSDISLIGTITLKKSPTVRVAGVNVNTTLLTAWALEAVDNHTSEVIFSENFRPPRGTAYNDEEQAMMDVGKKVGNVFSRDLFSSYVMRPTHEVLLTFVGIKERELAKRMKQELLGIRSVLNVVFREFMSDYETVFEVEFGGSREGFTDILDGVVLTAFNRKYGAQAFAIQEEHGDIVRIAVKKEGSITQQVVDEGLPIQLTAGNTKEKLNEVIKSPELKEKVEKVKESNKQLMDL